ncbi:MAG: hypothetical protein ACI3ZT_05990 [Candidatus Cryptobacteroides sp.]
MGDFENSVLNFLSDRFPGVESAFKGGFRVFSCPGGNVSTVAVPVVSETLEDAECQAERLESAVKLLKDEGRQVVILPEDIWRSRSDMIQHRLLAQLGVFRSVFARNTEVRRIDKVASSEFFTDCHTYRDAAARYRYGLYDMHGRLVAAASFSGARVWDKPEGKVSSCEWVRYASLPDIRVVGGMGKVLKAFISEAGPDNVMSYADLEWTDGAVYERLGFKMESLRSPVAFAVDRYSYERVPLKYASSLMNPLFHINRGSIKYRLLV